MKFSRLFQPRNPLFWLMIAFNVLSSVLAWVLRTWPLNTAGTVVVGLLALADALAGIAVAVRLMRMPDEEC